MHVNRCVRTREIGDQPQLTGICVVRQLVLHALQINEQVQGVAVCAREWVQGCVSACPDRTIIQQAGRVACQTGRGMQSESMCRYRLRQ